MPFIGNKPSAVPLTSADITDGIITSAKIADAAIVGDDINSTFNLTGKTVTLPSGVGGKVLQVITATDSTARTTTSATFVTASNTLSVSITPSSASNKVFIVVGATFGGTFLSNNPIYGEDIYFTIYRDATNLGNGTSGMGYTNMSQHPSHLSYLDSPNTTSATTYQVYFRSAGSTGYLNTGSTTSSITAFEIAG
jgi:hypothetical protein